LYLLIPPLVYMILMVPAWIAGKPFLDLLTVYYVQAGYYSELSKGAPNPWTILLHLHHVNIELGARPAEILAIAAGLLLTWVMKDERRNSQRLMTAVLAGFICIPFVLPKMHERYFFPADVLSYVLAIAFPGRWTFAAAVLVQFGSISAYCNYLANFRHGADLGALFMGVAVLIVARQIFAGKKPSDARGDLALN
jgi:Gpi18-like mannosyltransferase